jgi:hypothetical protein
MAANDPPPCIWDSLDALQGHPLLHTALENVKAKIGNCLSRSYDICDKPDTNDRMQVLLNLPGVFTVGDMESEDPQDIDYAFTDNRGVTINEILVNASTAYHEGGEHDELTTASYVALFEEVIEHELAHLKTHHEKLDDPGIQLLTSPPLHGESGYAVHLKTRGRSLTMAASLLEVSQDCFRRDFAPPLSLYLCPIDLANSVFRGEDGGDPLTLKESKVTWSIQRAALRSCDNDRNPKTAFKPSEDMNVLLTFKNPATATDAVIHCIHAH